MNSRKYKMFYDFFRQLSEWGYPGIFLISLIGSSTIIFPLPAAAFVFAGGAFLNPTLLGVLAGSGSALGELIGYGLGRGGRKLGEKKFRKDLEKAAVMFEKYGGFITLMVFAATPLPDDIVGIIAGVFNYNIRKFFLAVLLGKIILHLTLAWAGFYGVNGVLKLFF